MKLAEFFILWFHYLNLRLRLCGNLFCSLHSNSSDQVRPRMGEDTETPGVEVPTFGLESLESSCQFVSGETPCGVTDPIPMPRFDDERSGLEEPMNTNVNGSADVSTNIEFAKDIRNPIPFIQHDSTVEGTDPCEQIYEDLARLYVTETTPLMLMVESTSTTGNKKERRNRERLPDHEISTVFPPIASPMGGSVIGENVNYLGKAQVFSTELAAGDLTAATRDAQPLDRGDFRCPDLFRNKSKTKNSQKRVNAKESRLIQERLRTLGYLEECDLPSHLPLTFDAPPLEIFRPTYHTAAVRGRIHLKHVELLVDSGSNISVVGLEFAQKHLRRCKRTAYKGSSITVADNNSVKPLGIIYAEVEVGPSRLINPFVVFPYLPVPVLLGTDWLTESEAITDWKAQRMTFHGANKAVACVTVFPFDVAALHLLNTVVIAPQSGIWTEASTGSKSHWSRLPKATVMTTIDP